MTVRELIIELETKDPDALVYRYVGGEQVAEAVGCTEDVKVDNENAGVLLNWEPFARSRCAAIPRRRRAGGRLLAIGTHFQISEF